MRIFLATLILFSTLGAFSGNAGDKKPYGKYWSKDDMGVFVFRRSGDFGYDFPVKVDLFNTRNLPPKRGKWKITKDGKIEIELEDEPYGFLIEWLPKSNSFYLIRTIVHGTFPAKSLYQRSRH